MVRIYLGDNRPFTGRALETLQKAGEILRAEDTGEEDFVNDLKKHNPEIVIVGARRVTRNVLSASSRLLGVIVYGVSYDFVDVKAASELGVMVVNTPGVNATAVAEFALGLILNITKDIQRASVHTKNREWTNMTTFRFGFNAVEIAGRTVGIVGLGRIGSRLARSLVALGAKVVSYTKHPSEERSRETGVEFVDLDELMSTSDVVVVTCALTEETRGLLGRRQIELMKKGSYFVNVTRGAVLDETAVFDALKEGRIAGAAFDILTTEPNAQSPFFGLENVVCTPHIGGRSVEANQRQELACAEEALRISKGERPDNLVNPDSLQFVRS